VLCSPRFVGKSDTLTSQAKEHTDVDTRILTVFRNIVQQGGLRALFAGIVPRVTWIGLGGAVFLGTFDVAAKILDHNSVTGRH